MEKLAESCSAAERRADEATREVISRLKCEYMQNKIGKEYDGLITGVTAFGLFVELENLFVSGLIHISSLDDDYYNYDKTGQRLIGEHSGKVYRLSDKVRIRVVQVNVEEQKIDFELV